MKMTRENIPFQEFFAGSGLVGYGLSPYFRSVWANDVSDRKAAVYRANFDPDVLHVGDISGVKGTDIPPAELSWASFPCQDLSLAGKIGGIRSDRSGLVWQWLRVIDEQGDLAPRVVCLENVAGLVSSHGGDDYRQLHLALSERGYRAGAVLLNASHFVPQSRPRVFVIATRGEIPSGLVSNGPSWLQPRSVANAARSVDGFVWWSAPEPPERSSTISDVIEDGEPFDRDDVLDLMPEAQREKFDRSGLAYATGYRRTRSRRQVLELRCDGVAGCLRTPSGGSSRQFLIGRDGEALHARLFTAREVARLMGAPDSFILPKRYNDAYLAMGDAVVAPVAHWLAATFLEKLVRSAYEQ